MSWQNKIENIDFEITTGDGKTFRPLWKTTGKTREFNTAIFDFINVEGSLVERKKGRSAAHTLVFYFQGENNIEDTAEFDASASDSRAWKVTHPFYGPITGQPLNIDYNEDSLNVTVVTVDFWETINADFPDSRISVRDNVEAKKVLVLESSSIAFTSDVTPESEDISKIKDSNALVAASFGPIITDENSAEFSNATAKSLTAADSFLADPGAAIRSAQAVFDIPATFASNISSKVSAFLSAYAQLKLQIETVSDKLFFEAQGAACISSLCNAAVNPSAEDYVIRTEIESVVEDVLEVYNDYTATLDAGQVEIYNVSENYTPNVNTQTDLYNLVAFTIGNLYNFAFEAKQLRTVYTSKNTNVILLAHRYLGPSEDDSNLATFIEINNIRLKELIVIKKGRKINYFV
jgi:hypothetical protein